MVTKRVVAALMLSMAIALTVVGSGAVSTSPAQADPCCPTKK
jgi:hypothetical protein